MTLLLTSKYFKPWHLQNADLLEVVLEIPLDTLGFKTYQFLIVVFDSTLENPSSTTNTPSMAQLVDFFAWNNGHLLVIIDNSPAIPQVVFKVLSKYDGFGKTPYEHC